MVSAVYRGDEAKPSVQTCTCVDRTCNGCGVTGDRYGVVQSHLRCDPCYTLTVDHVHASAVGKYCNELSGFLALTSAIFLLNVGHALLQLAWSFALHDTQDLSLTRQLLVLWDPAQLPQMSFSVTQSLAEWFPFQPWHLRHLIGSFLARLTWHFLLQIRRPFVMALFAAFASSRDSRR